MYSSWYGFSPLLWLLLISSHKKIMAKWDYIGAGHAQLSYTFLWQLTTYGVHTLPTYSFKAQVILRTTPVTIRTFNTPLHTQVPLPIQLDWDSHTLLVDNGCSTSITNCMDEVDLATSATHVGTVCWKIEDDLGRTHDILLPNTYYSSHGKHCLLCPQHWAQTANDHHPHPNGTWCATYANCIILYWDQQQYQHTVKLLPHSNVGGGNSMFFLQQRRRCNCWGHRGEICFLTNVMD